MKEGRGFLKLPADIAPVNQDCKAVIIPFGLEASVTYGGGTSKGPEAIIENSAELEWFDEYLWCEPWRNIGIATLEYPKISKDITQALEQLDDLVQKTLDSGKFPLVLGGEHSISAGSIRPFARKYDDFAILHFDAHADLRDGYRGEHYSHAAALRRCLDHQQVTKLISCGIRNISASEIPFLEANKKRIDIHWGKDIKSWNAKEIVAPLKGKKVYLTFDVDGFDASLMPATGTPEPGGMLWNDALEIIQEAAKICDIVGADVNELSPIDSFPAPNFTVAKLVYKIISLAHIKSA